MLQAAKPRLSGFLSQLSVFAAWSDPKGSITPHSGFHISARIACRCHRILMLHHAEGRAMFALAPNARQYITPNDPDPEKLKSNAAYSPVCYGLARWPCQKLTHSHPWFLYLSQKTTAPQGH